MKKIRAFTALALSLILCVSGCGNDDPIPQESQEIRKTEETQETDSADGWWARPEGYQMDFYDPGIFCMELQDTVLTFYDSFGQPEEVADYELEDGTVWIWSENSLGPYVLDGDTMRNIHTDAAEFVRIEEPVFEDLQDAGYNGKWFLFGDPNGEFYEISGNEISKDGETDTFSLVTDRMMYGTGDVPSVTILHTDTMYTELSVVPNLPMLVYDSLQSDVYLREDAAQDPWMLERTAMVYSLLNGQLQSEDHGDGQYYSLEFHPEGFSICTFTGGEGSYAGDHSNDLVGTWELADQSTVILHYSDGNTDTLEIPWEAGGWETLLHSSSVFENVVLDGWTCYLDSLGEEFTYVS